MTEERRKELREVGFKTLEALAERSGDSRVRLDAAIELLAQTDEAAAAGGPKPRTRYYGGSSHATG